MKIVIHGKQLPVSFQAEQPRSFWSGFKHDRIGSMSVFFVTELLFRLLGRIARRKQHRNALFFTKRRCCDLGHSRIDKASSH